MNATCISANTLRSWELHCVCITVLVSSIFALIFIVPNNILAVDTFTIDERPFGISYDDWVAKYWTSTLNQTHNEANPKPGGCLIFEHGPMIMLANTVIGGTHNQICEISSEKGIMIPLWIAWCDTGADLPNIEDSSANLDEKLTECAREEYNLGKIGSEVEVDDLTIAQLDVINSLTPSGSLDYKINTLENVSEIYTKGFNLTVPTDTFLPNLVSGTWRAGSHGWWVFLEPLSPGNHTISYNVRVFPTGALTSPGVNPTTTDFTYTMKVT
jgi:hypothetical protein